MSVRVCTLGVSLLRLGGKVEPGKYAVVELNKQWQAIAADAHPRIIASLRDLHGKHVQVHPADRERLGELGLLFVAEFEPLAVLEKKPEKTESNPDAAGGKTDATKTGGKSAKKE